MLEIENTGERLLLDKETPLMIARHFCAYKFAKDYVSGKKVLDIGCGEGYGPDFLAGYAKEVVGIDYNKAIIEYARNKYHKSSLDFFVLDVADLNSLNRKFDVICSFQNIEHIQDAEKLLKDVANLLNDRGVFICSTCNMKDASPGSNVPFNKFHVKEYLVDEFKSLLKSQFRNVEMLGLKRGLKLEIFRSLKKSGVFSFLPEELNPVKRFFSRINDGHFFWTKKDLDSCLDFIAVCGR